MTRVGQSSKKQQPKLRAALAYLDITCTLVKLPGGTSRVILSFRDWANGRNLSSHDDFATEDQALDSRVTTQRVRAQDQGCFRSKILPPSYPWYKAHP